MFNWLNASITRKISSLSFVLLSFLFVVILYSVFKLQQINHEMQEVAQIDVPLTEVMADIEVLQLKQHLQMEKVRQQGGNHLLDDKNKAQHLESFHHYDNDLSAQLDKAMTILQKALTQGSVRINITEHQALIGLIRSLHVHRDTFSQLTNRFFMQNYDIYSAKWQDIERQSERLDSESDLLLRKIDQLTLKVAAYAEKQEREFMIVNAILGLSALAIGIYLTFYIIQSFRNRVGSMRWQIESLNRAVAGRVGEDSKRRNNTSHADELGALETDLTILVNELSKERHSRYEVEQKLMELATHDKLTGVFNRYKWDEQLREELAFANRGGVLSLVLLDIDHFKGINDSFGHDVGDQVLKRLSNELRNRLRSADKLFRTGGEEFAILLRGSDEQSAAELAEQLRAHIEQCPFDGVSKVTISLGVTSYQDGDDANSFTKRADIALYDAKHAGRNLVKIG